MVPPTKITEQEPGEQDPRPFDGPFGGSTQAPARGVPASSAPTDEMTAALADTAEIPATTSTGPPALVTASGEHCAVCGAEMAADQRYCLQCGERRGQARFAAPAAATSTAATSTRTTAAPRGSKWSPGATLIAGVATLLLAMGIGVLIGRSGTSSPSSSPKAQVITINGAGAGAGAAAAAATTNASQATTASSGAKGNSGKSANNKASTASSSSTAANAASQTAKTVTALPPPTVTLGQKGSGAGYQHGKFTGNFFGGGG